MNELSQTQIDYFLNNGYLLMRGLFNLDEVNIIQERINSLKNQANELAKNLSDSEVHKITHQGTQFVIQNIDASTKIYRFVWAGSAEADLLNLSRQNKLLTPVAQLLETSQANHIINSVHPKFSGDGVEYTIHQDIYHRRNYDPYWENINGDRSYVACITAINPMTKENGPIMVIPGSQMQGEIASNQLKYQDLTKAVPLLLEPGDTACMHQYLLHYSLPNESSNSRFTLINGFSYPDANHSPYPGEGSGTLIDLILPTGSNSDTSKEL